MGTEFMLPKIPILTDFGEWIGKGLMDAFLSLIWGLLTGLMWILDSLQRAFFFITGVETIPLNMNGRPVEVSLLELLFGIYENGQAFDFSMPLHKVYIGMLAVFVIVFVFFIICAAVKVNVNRENKESLPSMRKMLWKSVTAFFVVILLPIIFCLLLSFAGIFMDSIISLFKFNLLSGDSDLSISECLFKASVSADNIARYEDLGMKISWMNSDGSAMDYKTLIASYGDGGVSFVLLLIAVCCCLIGLGMSVLTVAERLINIAMLYVIAPVVIASIPLDDGKRWESWKDTTTVKILTAAANVISIYIFIYIMKEFGNVILSGQGDAVLSIVYIVIAISGAFGCAKAGTFIASIISANAGQQEGMSFLGNSAMLRAAGALAGGTLKLGGALLGIKSKDQANNSSGSGGGTGSGGGSGGGSTDTAHTRDDQSLADNYNEMRQNTQRQNLGGGASSTGGTFTADDIKTGTGGNLGKTVGNIMTSPLAAFNAVKKGAGVVGNVAKGAFSYLNVPGMLKLATGAVALGAAGLATVGYGIKKFAWEPLHNKISGKVTRVDRGSLQGTSRDGEVRYNIGQTEAASRALEKEGRQIPKLEKQVEQTGQQVEQAKGKVLSENLTGINLGQTFGVGLGKVLSGNSNINLIKKEGQHARTQQKLNANQERVAARQEIYNTNKQRLAASVNSAIEKRESKKNKAKKRLKKDNTESGEGGN